MASMFKYSFLFIKLLWMFDEVFSDTYNVKISTEHYVNLVNPKFLSFTVDPKFIFDRNGKYDGKHCTCMASSLTPAYLRLSGPSTSRMTFENSTVYIDIPTMDENTSEFSLSFLGGRKDKRISMTAGQWEKFVHWAKKTGFHLVFGLNNAVKTATGMWDPNVALQTLTIAEKANVGDIVWQMGYECSNQSIEEYLNDLETLRVIVETFPAGKYKSWKVVGGDVTPCLQADSKSDFKDYVTLSSDMMDAIFLNGNSSAQQLDKMTEADRLKLLRLLSSSETPLWLTEKIHPQYNDLERAADWLASLGYSARNGFSVHFRELIEKELHEPTLSFYMALLFKNLVGERVLDVDITASQAALFAHCTSLRHKPVDGAVTFFGVNMDEEPARFSLKLSKMEEGGDIMQFIFANDSSGNIIVNGHPMYLEGDIRPAVKRIRPYKTLLINLPPKSFGFWVLANTQIKACHYKEDIEKEDEPLEIKSMEMENKEEINRRTRRSVINKRDVTNIELSLEHFDDHHLDKISHKKFDRDALRKQIDSLNSKLENFHALLIRRKSQTNDQLPMRWKRQAIEKDNLKKFKPNVFKSKLTRRIQEKHSDLKSNVLERLNQFKNDKLAILEKNRHTKKNSKRSYNEACSDEQDVLKVEKLTRKRRNIFDDEIANVLENGRRSNKVKNKLYAESENELDNGEDFAVGHIMHKLKGTLKNLPIEAEEKIDDEYEKDYSDANEITLKTKLLDDGAIINISEKNKNGPLKSTFDDLVKLLSSLNKHLNKFWNTFTLLE